MLPIHEQAINRNWAAPYHVYVGPNDTAEFIHGLGSGPNKRYNYKDLLTHHSYGNGSLSWTQESHTNGSRVLRGLNAVSQGAWAASSSVYNNRGWRPVLELISD